VPRRSFPLLLLALLAAPALAACGEREEPLGELPQAYPVTVQGAGEQATTLGKRPARVVALDGGSARLLAALGLRRQLVGAPADARTSPRTRVVVSRAGQVDVPAITRLRPDLIVSSGSVDPIDVSRAQRESSAALYVRPDESVDEIVGAVLDLGFLAGEPVSARKLAEQMRRRVEAVEQRIAAEPLRTAFVDTGFFITIPTRSLLGDLVRRARGTSIGGKAPGPDPFPVRRLRQLDPDVYLATSESRVTLADLRADPRTASLSAVKDGRVVQLPSELVLSPGPRVGRALEEIARALHPDAFR
jgi:iron complex transport system substrate-binding protein